MPALYFATAMPTCPSPISSPSIPRTATGIVPRLWQCAMPVSRHAAARIEPLHFYSAGIARRIGADRHYSALITKIRCILSHDVQLLRQTMAFPGGRLRAGLADCRAPFFKSLLGVTIIAGSTGKELGGRSTTAAVSDRHCIPCDYPRRSVTIAGTAVSRVETGRRSFLC